MAHMKFNSISRSRYFTLPLLATGLFSSSAAVAQSGSLTWEVSSDNGATWQNSLLALSPGSIQVRAVVAWNRNTIPDGIGFASTRFDAKLVNAIAQDACTNISRQAPFDSAPQSLVASVYSGGIKIDDSGDTAEPGHGTGWIHVGQATRDQAGTGFNSTSPVVVFSYTYAFTTRYMRTVRFESSFSLAAGEAFSVYTSPSGARTTVDASSVIFNNAGVWIIPTPATSITFAACSTLVLRRRR